MVRHLFSKPMSEIEYNNVVAFCKQGVEEGLFVEYEEIFVPDLNKRVASFANSSGGGILLCVAKNKTKGVDAGERRKDS